MKKAVALAKRTTQLVGKSAVLAGRGVAEGARWGAGQIAEHRSEIASGATAIVRAAGATVEETGRAAAAGARAMSAGTSSRTGRVAGRVAGAVAAGVERAGARTRQVAPAVGEAVAGGADSAAGTVANAMDAVAIRERDIAALQERLQRANRSINEHALKRRAAIAEARAGRRKQDLLDWLAVGGVSLSAMAQRGVPAEVEKAFAATYPGLASQGVGFLDAVEGKSALQLMGLVNGVKGKLFELQLVEHLNDDNLPVGLTASLAGSATQPGYDLIIADERGQVVNVLQAKATESVAYVKAALERYPDIDITTTTEVYAQLMAQGVTDGLSDSGISEAVLQAKIESAAQGVGDGSDLAPSSIAVALLALTTFMDKSLTLEQRGAQFGERTANVAVTGTAGKAVLAATGYWWLGLAAGVGARVLAKRGGDKRLRLESLRRMVDAAERVARRGWAQGRLPVKVQRMSVRRSQAPTAQDSQTVHAVSSQRLPGYRRAGLGAVDGSTPAGAAAATPGSAVRSAATSASPAASLGGVTIRRGHAGAPETNTLTARDVVYGSVPVVLSDELSGRAARVRALKLSGFGLAVGVGLGIWAIQAPQAEVVAPLLPPVMSSDAQTQVKAELREIMRDALERYPYLNTAAGLQASREMIAERERRLALGESPQEALRGAVETVAPKHAPKKRRQETR